MKTIFTSIVLTLFSFPLLFAQNDIVFDAGDNWVGFMNVFNLDGSYNFGSAWEVIALKSTVNTGDNTLTLQPNFNTYAENLGDPFWVNQDNGEGAKTMEALTFVEPGDAFNGVDLSFSGAVMSNTLSDDYAAVFFIKALDPDNGFQDALGGAKIFPLPASGDFTVSAMGSELPAGLLIQYGFAITGRNANPDNEADLGSIVIVPEAVSVNDLNNLEVAMSVFPNPTVETLFIKSEAQVQSYTISTLLGQTVLSGNATNEIDVADLPVGTYTITVFAEEGNKVMKFVKS